MSLGRWQAACWGVCFEASKELCEGIQRSIKTGLYGNGASDPEHHTAIVRQERLHISLGGPKFNTLSIQMSGHTGMHCLAPVKTQTEYLTSIMPLCSDTSGFFADMFALVCGRCLQYIV